MCVYYQFANIQAAKTEIGKTKEQLAEEKKIALSVRIQPLALDVSAQSNTQQFQEFNESPTEETIYEFFKLTPNGSTNNHIFYHYY